jgi:hypothetical protein
MSNESRKKRPRWTRWMPIAQTSPSGKVLFVCLVCGDITPGPNNHCRRRHASEVERPLDPQVALVLPEAKTCSAVEDGINAEIEKNIADKLLLEWAENELEPFMDRNCSYCHGWGCHICVGRGKRW